MFLKIIAYQEYFVNIILTFNCEYIIIKLQIIFLEKGECFMKKFLCLLTALVIILSVVSCGNSSSLKDGTYRAKQAEEDYGWSEFVEITVEGGKITKVVFDASNANGDLKSADEGYRGMMEPVSGTYPAEFYPYFSNQLIEKQSIKDVEVKTGATVSYNRFILLVDALEENMKNGDTTEKVVVTVAE